MPLELPDIPQKTLSQIAADSTRRLALQNALGFTEALAPLTAAVDRMNLTAAVMGRDYVQSDGSTAGRRMSGAWGARGNVAGSEMTFACLLYVPTSNPANDVKIFDVSDNLNAVVSRALTVNLNIAVSGALALRQNGATTNDRRLLQYNGFRSAFSGRWVRLVVVITPGVANPIVYVNGVNAAASLTSSTNGTPPNWMDAAMLSTYFVAGTEWPAGPVPRVIPINRAWTQADVDWWQNTDRLPASDMAGGNPAASTVGALTLPTIQGNRTLLDGTANGNQMILTPGMTPQTSEKWWSASGRTHATASGNQLLLGGAIVADPTRHRIDSVVIRNTGTSLAIVSIGSVSGGAQYVSALNVPAGTTVDGTLLTRILGSDSFWVSSNIVGELAITIEGHRIAV